MADEEKDSTKVFSELESHFLTIQENEEKSKIDWFFLEVYEGREETRMLREQLESKQYNPAEILHVLFDYTFFNRVVEGEYDWRIGNDRELKEKCRGYISKAESVKKEIQNFAGPEGIARKVGYKGDPEEVNIYRRLLADAVDKNKTEELLANMMKADMKRCFEATETTMGLYSALAKIRYNIEEELLTRLVDPKVKSRTVPIREEDFEPPKPVEQKPVEEIPVQQPQEDARQKTTIMARPDQGSIINLDEVKLVEQPQEAAKQKKAAETRPGKGSIINFDNVKLDDISDYEKRYRK